MSFSKKIGYDLWANQKILDTLKTIKEETLLSECTRLFAHLFKAQIIWYNRTHGINEETEIWGTYTLEECISLLNDSHAMLEGLAARFGENFSYTNSAGDLFESSAEDIFEHVIIHGQHHRAQILTLLSRAGIPHPSTDYIFYIRSL